MLTSVDLKTGDSLLQYYQHQTPNPILKHKSTQAQWVWFDQGINNEVLHVLEVHTGSLLCQNCLLTDEICAKMSQKSLIL